MRTIEIDDFTYNRIEEIADIIQTDVDIVLSEAVSDGVLEEFWKDEIERAKDVETEDEKETICWGRKFWNE